MARRLTHGVRVTGTARIETDGLMFPETGEVAPDTENARIKRADYTNWHCTCGKEFDGREEIESHVQELGEGSNNNVDTGDRVRVVFQQVNGELVEVGGEAELVDSGGFKLQHPTNDQIEYWVLDDYVKVMKAQGDLATAERELPKVSVKLEDE